MFLGPSDKYCSHLQFVGFGGFFFWCGLFGWFLFFGFGFGVLLVLGFFGGFFLVFFFGKLSSLHHFNFRFLILYFWPPKHCRK